MNKLLSTLYALLIFVLPYHIFSSEKTQSGSNTLVLRKNSIENKGKSDEVQEANDSIPSFASKPDLQPPVSGKLVVLRKFTTNTNRPFRGLLIKTQPQSKVLASSEGTVLAIEKMEGYESIIFLEHPNKLLTVYANLAEVFVREGDSVQQGMELGLVHAEKNLYFQINKGSKSIDPAGYILPEK